MGPGESQSEGTRLQLGSGRPAQLAAITHFVCALQSGCALQAAICPGGRGEPRLHRDVPFFRLSLRTSPSGKPSAPLAISAAQGRAQHREQGSEKPPGAAPCITTCAAFSATWEETIV